MRTDEEVLADMEKNTQVTLLIESFDGPLMKNEIGCTLEGKWSTTAYEQTYILNCPAGGCSGVPPVAQKQEKRVCEF